MFVRFLIVGIGNTFIGYGLFSVFLYLSLHYTLAALLATILGVLFNFFTTGRYVFFNRDNRLIFRFISVYIVVYLFNITGLKLGEVFDINFYFSGMLLIIPLALLSFFLNKHFVFKDI